MFRRKRIQRDHLLRTVANRRHRHQTICGWLKAANDNRDQAAATTGNTAGVVRALEPKYGEVEQPSSHFHPGFTRQFMKSLMESYQLWQKPLQDICGKGADRKVKTFMVTPSEGEFVDENATLDEAIHQLVMGRHQSVLVLRQKKSSAFCD